LRQATAARKAAVSPDALGHYEAGRRNPPLAVAFRIAEALDTTVEALFKPNPGAAPPPAPGGGRLRCPKCGAVGPLVVQVESPGVLRWVCSSCGHSWRTRRIPMPAIVTTEGEAQ
jgi:DNA-binding XRE family transcriptional regulator